MHVPYANSGVIAPVRGIGPSLLSGTKSAHYCRERNQRYRGGGGVVIRPPNTPTAPPTAAPRAAPCPPAAAAPIAAPLPAPIRPPPIARWAGSYGLVQADKLNASPTTTTRGKICRLIIASVIPAPIGLIQQHRFMRWDSNVAPKHTFQMSRAL